MVRKLRGLDSKGSMAVPEGRDNVTPGGRKTPGQVSSRTGLSPTVEKMFGALVDASDEGEEDNSAESEGIRGRMPSRPPAP